MSAFEISLANAADQEADADSADIEAVPDGETYTLRASDTEWIEAENPVEVTQ